MSNPKPSTPTPARPLGEILKKWNPDIRDDGNGNYLVDGEDLADLITAAASMASERERADAEMEMRWNYHNKWLDGVQVEDALKRKLRRAELALAALGCREVPVTPECPTGWVESICDANECDEDGVCGPCGNRLLASGGCVLHGTLKLTDSPVAHVLPPVAANTDEEFRSAQRVYCTVCKINTTMEPCWGSGHRISAPIDDIPSCPVCNGRGITHGFGGAKTAPCHRCSARASKCTCRACGGKDEINCTATEKPAQPTPLPLTREEIEAVSRLGRCACKTTCERVLLSGDCDTYDALCSMAAALHDERDRAAISPTEANEAADDLSALYMAFFGDRETGGLGPRIMDIRSLILSQSARIATLEAALAESKGRV